MYLAHLLTFFLAAFQSLVLAHDFQGGEVGTEKQMHPTNDQSITTAMVPATNTIVTTFKTIVTARNSDIIAQDYESTVSSQEAKNFNFRNPMWWKSPIFHQAIAPVKPTEKSSNLFQAKNRRNFINLGPLPTFIPPVTTPSPATPPPSSAISTSSLTITFPDLTTAFAVTTISAN